MQQNNNETRVFVEWNLPRDTIEALKDAESVNSPVVKDSYDDFYIHNLVAAFKDYYYKKGVQKYIYLRDQDRYVWKPSHNPKLNEGLRLLKEDIRLPTNIYNQVLTRLKSRQKSFFESKYEIKNRVERSRTPIRGIIAGKGTPSAYDSSLSLHSTWGFPYIPASGFQGSLRSMLIRLYFHPLDGSDDAGEKAEKEALEDEGFLKVFGNTEQAGCIDFLDVFPSTFEQRNLSLEVNSPHTGDYYQKDEVPNPLAHNAPAPFFFWVVINTSFTFRLGGLNTTATEKVKSGKWKGLSPLEIVEKHLDYLFEYEGIGAKRKVNYGTFR